MFEEACKDLGRSLVPLAYHNDWGAVFRTPVEGYTSCRCYTSHVHRVIVSRKSLDEHKVRGARTSANIRQQGNLYLDLKTRARGHAADTKYYVVFKAMIHLARFELIQVLPNFCHPAANICMS